MQTGNKERVIAVLDAFCRKDLDVAADYFAEDATLTNNTVTVVHRGRPAIRAHLERWHTMFSDAAAHSIELLEAGNTIVGIFYGEGTNTGPIGDKPATGKRYSIRYCEIYHFGPDGKIVANEAFFDQLTMLRQLGLAT
ncbi:Ketosteroid isomerase-related protein [Nannocystis exedens]|uniref:Ketosteroid isomerase-related protein n=1 Tax=Nannocystis exedens TaxID=54 RepID=A0A1I2C102_9BACT|nr:ester cyclase [Nannocystis exedens]PCC71135.1 SnoaL-like polyketide cyclase [Nannocystis exedens]SFE62051.1 Ketosteroid isomerase-related protein [Nannocystis exedens]